MPRGCIGKINPVYLLMLMISDKLLEKGHGTISIHLPTTQLFHLVEVN